MGYVHDTHMSKWITPSRCHYVTGTWSDAAGAVAGTIAKSKAAADNTAVVTIPIALPANSSSRKGSYVKSVEVYWEVLTAAMDAVTAVINLARFPANGDAFAAVTAQAFSYDAGHDTADPGRVRPAGNRRPAPAATPDPRRSPARDGRRAAGARPGVAPPAARAPPPPCRDALPRAPSRRRR